MLIDKVNMKRVCLLLGMMLVLVLSSCSGSTSGASLSNDEADQITATQRQQITAAIQVGRSLQRINNKKMENSKR